MHRSTRGNHGLQAFVSNPYKSEVAILNGT